MAAEMQAGQPKRHWTAHPGVIATALLAALLPLFGLALIAPCYVSAKRAGASTTPYVIALALSVVWTVAVYAVQAQIQPA